MHPFVLASHTYKTVDPGWGGGGVLLYFHTYVGSGHFLGFQILNFNIILGFQKNEYFLGYEDFVDIFWGSSQNWTIFRGHFYLFLKVKVQNGGYFLGC